MEELFKDIPSVINYIDKLSILLQSMDIKTKEINLAIIKLQEAVFWLTFANENIGEANEK